MEKNTKNTMKNTKVLNANSVWFHMFKSMFKSKDVKKMGPSCFTTYAAIKSFVDMSSGKSFPSIKLLIDITGMAKETILRNIKTLEKMGYVTKKRVGRHNEYVMREKIDILNDEGEKEAIASWDYVPEAVKVARSELKQFTMTGDTGATTVINIESLQIQVNYAEQCNQNYIDAKERIDRDNPRLSNAIKKIEEIRAKKK